MAPKTSSEAGLSVHPAETLDAPPANFIDLVTSYVVPGELYFCDAISGSQPLRMTQVSTGRYVMLERPNVREFVNLPDMRLRRILPAGMIRVRAGPQKFLVSLIDREDFAQWLECNRMMGVVFEIDADETVSYYYRALSSTQLHMMRINQHMVIHTRQEMHLPQALWGWQHALDEQAAKQKKGGVI